MITYRYGPYEPEKNRPWDMDRLMSLLSEMIMRHDMQLDEALRMLIDRGLPVNMFLREAGMQELTAGMRNELEARKQAILSEFEIETARLEADRDLKQSRDNILKHEPQQSVEQIAESIERRAVDELYREKMSVADPALRQMLNRATRDLEDLIAIENGQRRFKWTGATPLGRKEALEILDLLEELEKLIQGLRQAEEDGDLFNFSLERIAKHLGPEQYQEFIERREQIMAKMRELLEKQGGVVQSQDGELQLSPASIRKIGRRALEEIFSSMKSDSGGSHPAGEPGDSENTSSVTRPLDFGDSLSHLDIASSLVNSYVRRRSSRPVYSELEVFEARGQARSATVILIDMSGSMMRSDRFYNAKKVVLALEALIREDYPDEKLIVVGFGTLARRIVPSEVPSLQPYAVTMFDPHIRLRYDMSRPDMRDRVPLYFTNLQRGLELSRTVLGGGETSNKQIILITDGVPTAHLEAGRLHINYPPSPADFEFALREVRKCTEEDITMNTFLLTSDWEMDYFGDESFMKQFARQARGRIFYPHPSQMNQMVLVDFINSRKSMFQY